MSTPEPAMTLIGRMVAQVRRRRLFLSISAAVLLLYTLAGFFLVPRIVQSQLQTYVTQTLHRQVKLGALHFNPFTLEVRAENFDLREADGTPLVAFKHLLVNAELASLWQRAINLKEVRLDAPDVQLLIDSDGSVNLAKLAPPTTEPEPVEAAPPPKVRIGLLSVSSGRVGIEDRSAARPFTSALAPIQFTLKEFKTDLNYENAYQFSGVSLSGEELEWSGAFTVQPLGSNGQFAIRKLKAATMQSYLHNALPFVLASGEVALAGRYHVAIDPALDLNVDLSNIAVRDLAIAERDDQANAEIQPLVTLPSVDVSEVAMSYARRSVTVKSVMLQGAHVDLQREADGSINILRLLNSPQAPSQSDTPAASQAASTVTSTESTGPAWQVGVDRVQLTQAQVVVTDHAVTPVARFDLNPIALTIDHWSTAPDAAVQVLVDVAIDQKSKLTAEGKVQLTPLNAQLKFKLDSFALASLQPYLDQQTQMKLHSGALTVQGSVSYAGEPSNAPPMKFVGDVSVDNLRTTDKLVDDDFVKWQRLAITGITASTNPDRLSIERIVARQPYARVVIAADQVTNVSQVLSAPSKSDKSGAAVATTAPPATAPEKVAATKPMPIRIKSIQVVDGAANFADFSIQPNFATGILDLNGSVTGLSSDPASRAKVKFEGKVDRYAPVDINGEINVLSATTYSDVALKFANMELTTFNPYSGKFAGYNISKGKLSTELRYRVEDRKLDAQHHIVIDNLEFGAKTDSQDAAPIPLKLAIALLKDRNGVIDLNLPVGGSLDDPQFRIAPIVWQALVSVLKKIAMAPFAAIGALFGGGDELAYVDFDPGSAALSAIETEKLTKLAQGLVERPELRLNIPLTIVDARDSEVLAQQALAALLPPALANAPDDAATKLKRIAAFEAALKKTTGVAVVYPAIDPALPKSDPAAQSDAKLDYLQKELLKTLQPDASTLAALARQRANIVQATVLSNIALDAQRVFLTSEQAKEVGGEKAVRMEMELE